MSTDVMRFIDCHVPVSVCNFSCEYCSVEQKKRFGAKFKPFPHPVEHIAKALSKERFGGVAAINMCGNGETMLHPELVPLVGLLLQEGHYVSIVTNGTIRDAMNALFSFPPAFRERLFIKFSFHYAELKKRNLLSCFIENVKNARAQGLSVTVELVAAECNMPFIEEIAKCCLDNFGALCHVTDPRDMVSDELKRLAAGSLEEHQKLWGQFESALFDYRQATWGKNRRGNFCYAGEFGGCVSLANGVLSQCNKGRVQNIFDDIDEPIHFMACGNNCPFAHCFNSHVWDCFVGVIPGMQSPSYAQLRNRVCADGSEWLTPAYKALYSEKLCNRYAKYNEERKIFVNGVMALTYGKGEIAPGFPDIVKGYLRQAGFVQCALYGDNALLRWLDENIEGLTPLDDVSAGGFDAVIVTDYKNIAANRALLAERFSVPVIDVRDLPQLPGKGMR